jgi:hypothetical protein
MVEEEEPGWGRRRKSARGTYGIAPVRKLFWGEVPRFRGEWNHHLKVMIRGSVVAAW